MREPELFIQGNPVVLGVLNWDFELKEYKPFQFKTLGAKQVDIFIGDRNITNEQTTVDFDNDDGRLTIHRNDLVLEPSQYAIVVRIIDDAHPAPGQAVINPWGSSDIKVIFEVPNEKQT